ncbi:MAG: hypothetical protein M5U29_05265 [Anaerolineae bacterium]|nr:hypothetical protein [Anaerolineae bacterium]
MVVGDNQPTLKADVALLFARPPGPQQEQRVVRQVSKGHGRLETRTLSASADLKGYVNWPGVEQGLRLERRVISLATGEVTTEVEYGVLSLTPDQIDLMTVLTRWRGHWSIENQPHRSRDGGLGKNFFGFGLVSAGLSSALRNTVISLVKRLGHASLTHARLHYALNLHEALSVVGIS